MTFTNVGWQGTVNEQQQAVLWSLGGVDAVGGSADWRVSQSSGRTLAVAAGNAFAKGVLTTSDAAVNKTLGTPAAGQWYLITRRISWAASPKTVTVEAIAHTTTTTTVPTAPPGTFPTIETTPGVAYDQPLAWAWVRSSDTTMVLFDLRTFPLTDRLKTIETDVASIEASLSVVQAVRQFDTVADLAAATGSTVDEWGMVQNAPGALYSHNVVAGTWTLSNTPAVASTAARDALFSGALQPVIGNSVLVAGAWWDYFTIGATTQWWIRDTGWVTIPAATGFTTSSNAQYRRERKRISLQGAFVANTGTIAQNTVMGTLPPDAMVTHSMILPLVTNVTNAVNRLTIISTAGTFLGAFSALPTTVYVDGINYYLD
jgi:hypothetical protein